MPDNNISSLNKKLTEIQNQINVKNKTLQLAKKDLPRLQAAKKEWDDKLSDAIKKGLASDYNRQHLFNSIRANAEAAYKALKNKQNEINNYQKQINQLTKTAEALKKQIAEIQ